MTYITVSDVRYASGVPTSLASNAAIEHAIAIIEPMTERAMNTKFKPTLRIDILDGTGKNHFFTDKNPLLRVEALKSDDNSLDVDALEIYKSSGKIALGINSDSSIFVEKQRSIVCKYRFGLLDQDDDTQTTISAAASAGSSVNVTVASATGFTENDWVEIYGMDGNKEVAQITAISGTTFTLDKISFDHEADSILIKIQIPQYIKRFMELEATIYVALNAIGATYTFNASYNLADLQVTKGVPYTHWRESLEKAIKERESLRRIIKPRFKIVVN